MLAYRITEETVTVFVAGVPTTITKDNRAFKRVCQLIRVNATVQEILDALEFSKATVKYTSSIPGLRWTDDNATAFYRDEELPDSLVERMKNCLEAGTPVAYLEQFIAKLWSNPSMNSRHQAYSFLEHKNLPITSTGTFLGYKSLTPDWKDWHTHTFDNRVGNTLSMERRKVDDDSNRGCSYGFHVGSLEYAATFGGPDRIIAIVEVDPADIVSVPADCSFQKLRTCRYTVVGKYDGPLPTAHVEDIHSPYEDDEDEDEWEGSGLYGSEEVRVAMLDDATEKLEAATEEVDNAAHEAEAALAALEQAKEAETLAKIKMAAVEALLQKKS